MGKKERKDIRDMVDTARILAENDPLGFMIVKSNIDVLKARHDMELAEKRETAGVEAV